MPKNPRMLTPLLVPVDLAAVQAHRAAIDGDAALDIVAYEARALWLGLQRFEAALPQARNRLFTLLRQRDGGDMTTIFSSMPHLEGARPVLAYLAEWAQKLDEQRAYASRPAEPRAPDPGPTPALEAPTTSDSPWPAA